MFGVYKTEKKDGEGHQGEISSVRICDTELMFVRNNKEEALVCLENYVQEYLQFKDGYKEYPIYNEGFEPKVGYYQTRNVKNSLHGVNLWKSEKIRGLMWNSYEKTHLLYVDLVYIPMVKPQPIMVEEPTMDYEYDLCEHQHKMKDVLDDVKDVAMRHSFDDYTVIGSAQWDYIADFKDK